MLPPEQGGWVGLEEGTVLLRSRGPGESAESPAGRGSLAVPQHLSQSTPQKGLEQGLRPGATNCSYQGARVPDSGPSFLQPQGVRSPPRSPKRRGYLRLAPCPTSSGCSRSKAATSAATPAAAAALSAAHRDIWPSLQPRVPRPLARLGGAPPSSTPTGTSSSG